LLDLEIELSFSFFILLLKIEFFLSEKLEFAKLRSCKVVGRKNESIDIVESVSNDLIF